METALNNCTIMFDLLKLFQKKQELQLALVGATESLSDAYRLVVRMVVLQAVQTIVLAHVMIHVIQIAQDIQLRTSHECSSGSAIVYPEEMLVNNNKTRR